MRGGGGELREEEMTRISPRMRESQTERLKEHSTGYPSFISVIDSDQIKREINIRRYSYQVSFEWCCLYGISLSTVDACYIRLYRIGV